MWNGSLFTKSIGQVRFVRLVDMTYDDWRTLEYENLRLAAQNKIANLIINHRLVGFLHVHIVEKAKAKPDYYEAATEAVAEAFGSENFDIHDHFGYTADEHLSTNTAVELRFFIDRFLEMDYARMMSILDYVKDRLKDEDNAWGKERLAQVNQIDEFHLESLDRNDAALLISTIILWEYALEEAEHLLDDLEDSDDKDDVLIELENERARLFRAEDLFA